MSRGDRGLTLLEMVLVVVVLMIVAGLFFGAWTYVDHKMRTDATETRLSAIGFSVRKQLTLSGFPPARLADVAAAVGHPEWMQGGSFVDGWDRPLKYDVADRQFRLWSTGADGRDGTEDDLRYTNN